MTRLWSIVIYDKRYPANNICAMHVYNTPAYILFTVRTTTFVFVYMKQETGETVFQGKRYASRYSRNWRQQLNVTRNIK